MRSLLDILCLVILTVAAGFCLTKVSFSTDPGTWNTSTASYVILFSYGLLELIRNCFDVEINSNVIKFMSICKQSLSLPLVVTQVWLDTNFMESYFAYAHSIFGCLFTVLDMSREENRDVLDPFILLNILSLSIVGYTNNNFYALGAATLYGLGYGIKRDGREILGLSANNVFNLFLAGFLVCTSLGST